MLQAATNKLVQLETKKRDTCLKSRELLSKTCLCVGNTGFYVQGRIGILCTGEDRVVFTAMISGQTYRQVHGGAFGSDEYVLIDRVELACNERSAM